MVCNATTSHWLAFVCAVALGATAAPAVAKDAGVSTADIDVDAKSGPWIVSLNPKLDYGVHDQKAPAVLWKLSLIAGATLHITATGSTTTVEGGGGFSPDGQADWTDDHGVRVFPSHYMFSKTRPVHLNELVGAFVDGDGVVVGKPFPIGTAALVVIPKGAAALSMGINDDVYYNNTGSLHVHVTMSRVGRVEIEGEGNVH